MQCWKLMHHRGPPNAAYVLLVIQWLVDEIPDGDLHFCAVPQKVELCFPQSALPPPDALPPVASGKPPFSKAGQT